MTFRSRGEVPGRRKRAGGLLLPAVLLAVTWVAPGWAQTDGSAGKVLDLIFRVEDIGGKVQDLEVRESGTEVVIALAADVLFAFDRADLKPAAAATLKSVADVIREKGGANGRIRVEGHTDGKGGEAYNQRLSVSRAEAVRKWLVEREKVANARLVTAGFGAKKPIAPNTRPDGSDDPEGRQKNRRVEIVVQKIR